jgi:hypothetical protein
MEVIKPNVGAFGPTLVFNARNIVLTTLESRR